MTTDQTGLEPAIGPVPTDVMAPEAMEAATAAEMPLYPPVPTPVFVARVIIGIALAAAALYAPFYFQEPVNRLLSQAIYLAIAAMGLNLLTGFNGQVSIGHGAFYGVGAFTSALLVIDHGWTYEPTILVAGLLTGVFGLLVGLPALRVRGLYLALVTLGLAVLFPRFATKFVEGPGGPPVLRPPRFVFETVIKGLADDQWVYFLSLGIMIVLFILARNLVQGRVGRAMIAVRDQELAAATVGVNLARTKVITFAISAAYAGVAGSLSLMVDRIADGSNPVLYFQKSIEFLVAMVIGGAATIMGPAVGALVVVMLRRFIMDHSEGKEILSPALFGAGLIVIVFVLPDGLVGGVRRLLAALGRLSSAKGRPPTTPIPDDSHD